MESPVESPPVERRIAWKPRIFGLKRWVMKCEDHQFLKVNGHVFLDDPNEITVVGDSIC